MLSSVEAAPELPTSESTRRGRNGGSVSEFRAMQRSRNDCSRKPTAQSSVPQQHMAQNVGHDQERRNTCRRNETKVLKWCLGLTRFDQNTNEASETSRELLHKSTSRKHQRWSACVVSDEKCHTHASSNGTSGWADQTKTKAEIKMAKWNEADFKEAPAHNAGRRRQQCPNKGALRRPRSDVDKRYRVYHCGHHHKMWYLITSQSSCHTWKFCSSKTACVFKHHKSAT